MNTVFSEVRQEESRLKVMMGSIPSVTTESSALVASNVSTDDKDKGTFFVSKKSGNIEYHKKYCKFCHKVGHVIEDCYRRPGGKARPPSSFHKQNNNFRQASSERSNMNNESWRSDSSSWRSSPKAAVADASSEGASVEGSQVNSQEHIFTPAQLNTMLRILESQKAQIESGQIRATMASAGKSDGKSNHWVVDSGATHHMTFNKLLLQSFTPFSVIKKVKVANGHFADILGYGDIKLTDTLNLKHVLYVPYLDCNLISVRRLMLDNACLTVFTPSKCLFLPSSCFQGTAMKEEVLKKRIGSASVHKGLFLLHAKLPGSGMCFEGNSRIYSCVNRSTVSRIDYMQPRIDLILLWHNRLGHPNFFVSQEDQT